MANVNIKEVDGGEATTLADTDGFEIDTGSESKYILPPALASEIKKRLASTTVEGMQLIWNSANSLSLGTGSCYAENGDFIDITSSLTASSLSLANSTWYHKYVYLNSGTPAMEVVTTAPVAWKGKARSKTGDTSRRYVGSVKTDGSGNIYKFHHNIMMNSIIYQNAAPNASPFRCLAGGTSVAASSDANKTVDLSAVIPVTSTLAHLRGTNISDQVAYINSDVSVSTTSFQTVLVAGNVIQTSIISPTPTDSSQKVYYILGGTAGVGGLNIDIYGYYYDR
jgi:hypothetical protein